ncbi:hypothetical protein DOY81_002739, partial [Sarcophaga bullata]
MEIRSQLLFGIKFSSTLEKKINYIPSLTVVEKEQCNSNETKQTTNKSNNMPNLHEEKLKSVIKYDAKAEKTAFREWFLKQFEADASNSCTVEEFAVYFLNTLRQCTEVHLKPSCMETPKCQTPVIAQKTKNVRENISLPSRSKLGVSEQNASTPNGKNHFENDISTHSTPRQSKSVDVSCSSSQRTASTPVRRNVSNNNSRRQSTTPNSGNKNTSASAHSLCLGDFMVKNTSKQNRSQKKKTVRTPTSNQQNVQQTQTAKPKKRLQPICLSKEVESSNNSSIFGGESSFSSENNILKISNTELEDKEQCAVLAARKSLKLNADEIAKELNNVSVLSVSVISDVVTAPVTPNKITLKEDDLNLKNLEKNVTLKRLAEVYTLIIDLNLTTNILNELSFLLNLLNAPYPSSTPDEIAENLKQLHFNDENASDGLECLEDLSHAVFFAILCLTFEKESLALLDTKSLSVVLIGERFSYLPDDIKTYLVEIHQHKQQLVAENPFCSTFFRFDAKPYSNVYFQQDQDSRENFTSSQEFANFRVQRDLFCKCLKIWDSNHLNPAWKFSEEVTPKIRQIFEHSENCINMAHLAKLFVSQLLLTASNSTSPEEIGLEVDMQKFSKLTQRLIAPSQFSVDYQFPRSEAFFRDFILEARSLAFAEQLKMELYTELISQNDSSFDHINIGKAENDADEQDLSIADDMNGENIVVKPEVLNSMLILAKFLGFTTALPYNINSTNFMPPSVEKDQIKLRSLMQSTIDISVILEQGIQQNKLLITIPWLVQYFAMLDNVTLHLDHYMKALKLMFALYSYLGIENTKPFNKASLFIIKLCLGWLFESKQFIAEQYYDFRRIFYSSSSKVATNELLFVRNKLNRHVNMNNTPEDNTLNAYLESILPIACPFLAEFRVSIMPANYAQTKNASRTGRYRHITTRIAELPSTAQVKENSDIQSATQNKPNKIQSTLIQAFLQSQNSSTRNLINFCIERCYKCVVKDGQLKILLPAKSNADNLVNQITSSEYRLVYNTIRTVYNDAYLQAKTNWDDSVDDMLAKRIRNALESLLPEETATVLKRTYFMTIKQETKQKVSQWFYANIICENFFCANLQEMANKVCSANKNKVQLGSSQLIITKGSPSISDLIDELQYWLYCTSIKVDRFKGPEPLIGMLRRMTEIFANTLPSLLYNLLSAGIIQLLQHIIAQHCLHLTDELLEAACNVWLHPNMKSALENSSSAASICIYDALVTLAFIESLGTRTESFNKLGHLFVTMIKKDIISLNYANDLFVSLFKYELHPQAMSEVSNMLRTIAKETATVPQHKT